MAASDLQREAEMTLSCRWTLQNVESLGPRTVQERVGGLDPDPQGSWFLLVVTQSSQL